MKKLLLLILISIISSCKSKFNGKNEEVFKISKEKIEKELNEAEKSNLENAFNVLAFKAYRIEQEKSDEYKGKTSKEISFEMVNGLTYTELLDLAENTLKDNNKNDIEETSKIIDSLNLKKVELAVNQKQYDLFKISSMKIIETKPYRTNELVPQLEIEFQYKGKETITGKKSINYGFKAEYVKQNNTTNSDGSFSSSSSSSSFNTGGSRRYDKIDIANGDIVKGYILLDDAMKGNYPKKYPVKSSDFSNYGGMEITVTIMKFFINGKEIERPEMTIPEIDAKIKSYQEKLNELKSKKAPFLKLKLKTK